MSSDPNPFANLSEFNHAQIRKYLNFFRNKRWFQFIVCEDIRNSLSIEQDILIFLSDWHMLADKRHFAL